MNTGRESEFQLFPTDTCVSELFSIYVREEFKRLHLKVGDERILFISGVGSVFISAIKQIWSGGGQMAEKIV